MHSLPTPANSPYCIGLKRKAPNKTLLAQRKVQQLLVAVKPTPLPSTSAKAAVDQDLLASVLRIHVERKLRKARLRANTTHSQARSMALQHAIHAVDEPSIQKLLSNQHHHYGFDASLAQLSLSQTLH